MSLPRTVRISFRKRREIAALERISPPVIFPEARRAADRHRRTSSCSPTAHERDRLTATHVEGNVVDRVNLALAREERRPQVLHRQQRLGRIHIRIRHRAPVIPTGCRPTVLSRGGMVARLVTGWAPSCGLLALSPQQAVTMSNVKIATGTVSHGTIVVEDNLSPKEKVTIASHGTASHFVSPPRRNACSSSRWHRRTAANSSMWTGSGGTR
jgi:hypothetical protein